MKSKEFKCDTDETRITDELLKFCGCSRPTLISWLQNWQVDGQPIGYLRGGRWVVNVERINKFAKGKGEYVGKKRKKRGRPTVRKTEKLDCCYYNDCRSTYNVLDQAMSCQGCKDYKRA